MSDKPVSPRPPTGSLAVIWLGVVMWLCVKFGPVPVPPL